MKRKLRENWLIRSAAASLAAAGALFPIFPQFAFAEILHQPIHYNLYAGRDGIYYFPFYPTASATLATFAWYGYSTSSPLTDTIYLYANNVLVLSTTTEKKDFESWQETLLQTAQYEVGPGISYKFAIDLSSAWDVIGSASSTCINSDSDCEWAYVITTGESDPYIGFWAPTTTERTYRVCESLVDVGCHLINAAIYLVVPDEYSLNYLRAAYDEVASTSPFSYVFDMGNIIDELFGNATTAVPALTVSTTLGQITLLDQEKIDAIPYRTLIRNLIGFGIVITAAGTIYYQVLNMYAAKHEI